MTAAAWHPDPTGRHELRYWDGTQWTEHVSDAGVQSTAPLTPPEEPGMHAGAAAEEQQVEEQPVAEPAPEVAPQEVPAEPMQAEPMAAEPMAERPAAAYGGGGVPGISGDLIGGRFSEVATGPGPSLQNSRLLRVRMTEPFMARQGSMVAYQGNVNFAFQGSGGAAKFLKKAFTGEGLSLMRVEGQGDVFLADAARHVHILNLANSGISVNGANVLAFGGPLDWDIERVKGGSVAAGGLFNTTFRGSGWIAITTEGTPVVLNAGEAPTFADMQAVVAWSVDLQTSVRSTATAGALIGRGSGEAFQVVFGGQGFVIVQPSEGGVVPPHSH